MKKIKLSITIFAFLILILSSCERDVLDKMPVDRFNEEVVWSDIKLADLYLLRLYRNLSIGFQNESLMMSVTDDGHNRVGRGTDIYVKGEIVSDGLHPWDQPRFPFAWLQWNVLFGNINKINIMLENIDNLPNYYTGVEMTEVEAQCKIMKGEALFLRALCYSYLAMNYGGVPLFIKQNFQTDDLLSIQRTTFKETVEFISNDCDIAATLLLPKGEMEMGRADIGTVLALKSRIWLFAASDLTADGTAANKYVGFESPNRNELWTNAKNAAKAVIDLGTYNLEDWGTDPDMVAKSYNDLFRVKDFESSELMWGMMYQVPDLPHYGHWLNGPNGQMNVGINAPTQNLVDAYQMADGSDFWEHFELDDNGYYSNISSKYTYENPYYNRDPRFYGTILYDSAVFQPRLESLQERDPLGIYERRDRIYIENGVEVERIPAIDGRQGPIYPTEATWTGYCMKKFTDPDNISVLNNREHDQAWIEFRYAEVLLNYAEACIGLGETIEAEKYINMIRNRASMPNFTGGITEALRYERRIELALENSRFYDIRRWKILEDALVNAKGIDIKEIHEDGIVKTTWQQTNIQDRGPISEKMYWIPISKTELNKAPQLIQNPGY